MESYAGEIPHAAAEAKNVKRFEGRIAVGIGEFTLETHNKRLYKETQNMCGPDWWWTMSTHAVTHC